LPCGFLILHCTEVATHCGHLLVCGPQAHCWNLWGRTNFVKLSQVRAGVYDTGGCMSQPTPFVGGSLLGSQYTRFPARRPETHDRADTSERNQRAIKVALELDLPLMGASDCRRVAQVGRAFRKFSNRIGNVNDFLRKIKAGQCRERYARA
jgi:hypothetical protein